MVSPGRAVSRVETMFGAAENVFVLLHQLQGTLIAGLVVILEIATDSFTENMSSSLKKLFF